MLSEIQIQNIFLCLTARAALLFWYSKVTCRGSEEASVSTGSGPKGCYCAIRKFVLLASFSLKQLAYFHVPYVRTEDRDLKKCSVFCSSGVFVTQTNTHPHIVQAIAQLQ